MHHAIRYLFFSGLWFIQGKIGWMSVWEISEKNKMKFLGCGVADAFFIYLFFIFLISLE